MITTYIYGSPYGFNFYDGVASWDDYFKSLYISSRRGKRLMVNRKDNGTTVYNFLCYGLMEKKGRPNAFFGCSIISDDGCFCPDLKELFEWFDYLFNKIVERGTFFHVNEEGKIQYKIYKFTDAADEAEWLKSNLPNIFTKSSDITLLPYDGTFSSQNSGRVVCRNIDTPIRKLTDDFRQSHWLAVSPAFALEEELEEINFADLDAKLNDYNQNILTLAVNPSPESLPVLTAIQDECGEVVNSLKKYAVATNDDTEKRNCREIGDKYIKLSDNITALIGKIRHTSRITQPKTYSEPPRRSKICRKCGLGKPVTSFTTHADICDDCARVQPEKAWWEKIDSTYIFAAILFVIISVSAMLIFRSCRSGNNPIPDPDEEETSLTLPPDPDEGFSTEYFYSLLDSARYIDAIEYAAAKEKKEEYLPQIKERIAAELYRILEETRPYSDITVKYMEFTTLHRRALEQLGYDTDALNAFAGKYQRLWEICSQESITPAAKQEAMEIIAQLPPEDQDAWRTRVSLIKIKQDATPPSGQSTPPRQDRFTITVTNEDNQNAVLSSQTVRASTTLSFKIDTYVTVTTSPAQKISTKTRGVRTANSYRVKVTAQPIVITVNDNIKITINGTKDNHGFRLLTE